MPWNDSGPDKDTHKPDPDKNPWDRRSKDRGNGDLDEMLRSWQRKLGSIFGGGKGNRPAGTGGGGMSAGINWGSIVLMLVAIWASTGFYIVDAAERGVILRFGRYVETTNEGLHWHWPWPIESKLLVDVARNESIEDKTRMLTSDENLVDITIAVQYLRADPTQFLFNVRNPEQTLRDVSESAIREIVGQSTLDAVLGSGRQQITEKTKALIQRTLSGYKTGIDILTVNLTAVNVPDPVAPSQKDAIKAREDRDRYAQEAQAYANDILPQAKGTAARRVEDAQAYKSRLTVEAQGDAERFNQLLAAYARSPKVTRERLYIETVENVLSRSKKVMVDTKPGSNVLYMPLDKLLEKNSNSDASVTVAPHLPPRPQSGAADLMPDSPNADPRARGER